MSLDVTLKKMQMSSVFDANITHNLGLMASKVKIGKVKKATLYYYLWRPDEIEITKARQLIEPLQIGLNLLLKSPKKYQKFNPSNGWGDYDGLVSFVIKYLAACKQFPNAKIEVDR